MGWAMRAFARGALWGLVGRRPRHGNGKGSTDSYLRLVAAGRWGGPGLEPGGLRALSACVFCFASRPKMVEVAPTSPDGAHPGIAVERR